MSDSKFLGRCLTCRHWDGNKKRQWEICHEYPMSMHLLGGWPLASTCDRQWDVCEIEVHGDATATVEFAANFGCIYWESDE